MNWFEENIVLFNCHVHITSCSIFETVWSHDNFMNALVVELRYLVTTLVYFFRFIYLYIVFIYIFICCRILKRLRVLLNNKSHICGLWMEYWRPPIELFCFKTNNNVWYEEKLFSRVFSVIFNHRCMIYKYYLI